MITKISKCCKQKTVEILEDNGSTIDYCCRCKNKCLVEEVCEECLGTGEISVMDYVYKGEPYMADIRSRNCPVCKLVHFLQVKSCPLFSESIHKTY